ncbi:MAG TPA: hypothetical protein VN668_03435 [Stellaceae bacterium]|nr:hypothetical protein [Stellaceae bacterium]
MFARQTDAFCARLNDGLTAVALVLAILTSAAAMPRLAHWLQGIDPGTGFQDF